MGIKESEWRLGVLFAAYFKTNSGMILGAPDLRG